MTLGRANTAAWDVNNHQDKSGNAREFAVSDNAFPSSVATSMTSKIRQPTGPALNAAQAEHSVLTRKTTVIRTLPAVVGQS